ncbi:MAG: hypothetical protein O3A63_06245 [Proteobacteria bacterium]|nr:hypothetical protein [Pseudomonadota bacterium]
MRRKVIQWSSGNIGKGLIRAIVERDDLELAGLYVFSDEKVGQDAGDIARIAHCFRQARMSSPPSVTCTPGFMVPS